MKNIPVLFIGLFLLSYGRHLHAQPNFYHIDSIPEIRIYFDQPNWDYLLDSLYIDGQEERLLANLVIDGVALDSVGIRYKGYSSVSVDRKKNPFNIKLDYVINGQKYDGIDKVKLSNVIQDPSFLRETLSYEIARKYMPASLANYAEVYINDEYWGLYTNVEAVNRDFLAQHYGSNDNAFFKCNPEELDFDGENSNLGNSPGMDTTEYYPFYDMRSDFGWSDLYELIDILNEHPEDIENILNVDRSLWMHAFNYALINFDSYVGYAQNYYLYQDDYGRFNPIIWDLNQSFASYRLTDASEFFDGFTIEEAKTMDPLLHYSSVSVYPRPLMRKLFENDTYRRMYLAHMRTIIEENFADGDYAMRGAYMQDLIEGSVLADTNKFYTDADFYNNLNSTVTDLVDYPGITDLMEARTSYLQSYPGFQGAPDIFNVSYTPQALSVGDDLWITAQVFDADEVTLAYRFGGNGLFQKVTMLDDGTQNDGAAGDGIYGIKLSDIGNSIHYYIYAENEEAGRFSPERAAYEYYLIYLELEQGYITINELLAINGNTVEDEAGEYDDWIELYNPTTLDLSTAGLYLSDELDNLKKWPLPDVIIASDSYLIVWADGDEDQGSFHANFKLSSDGETLFLSDENENGIDLVIFEAQTEDVSFGRIPNGIGSFVEMPPTFNAPNSLTNSTEEVHPGRFSFFPNPARESITVRFEDEIPSLLQVFSVDGNLLMARAIPAYETYLELDTRDFPGGLYFLNLVFEDFVLSDKLIIQP